MDAAERSPASLKRSRLGDLPMRVIYRVLAVGVAVAVAAVVALVVVLTGDPDESVARSVAAPSTVPLSSGATPAAVPAASPSAAVPSPVASPVASPGASIAPGYTAMQALRADRRLPALSGTLSFKAFPGRPAKIKGAVRDTRSGVAVPRLRSPWKVFGPAPFATRQVLPPVRGSKQRGMLVTCPVPIEVQEELRDTAMLAARWTLNHHPKGARITWVGSRPVKEGWSLVYRVRYGKRSSMAAVAVVATSKAKPALIFMSIPDTQKKNWPDLQRVISNLGVLG